jgi:NAD(P)-dependent dehydrogenase (short-subunit alcohol dehydrogenase family)
MRKNSFHDKVAIVTGGASGIGRELCIQLAQLGSSVVVADINKDGAGQVVAAIGASGGRAVATCVDVTQAEAVRELVRATTRQHGRLDLLFNNAGTGFWGEVRDTTLDTWHRVLDVNLWGVIHGTHAAYPVMVSQGFGHIVNTASLAGLVPVPAVTPYAAAKHAVVGLSQSLRAEAAELGVRVSVVCPGPVRTGFHDAIVATDAHRQGPGQPRHAVDAAKAASVILHGVERNQAIIIFPPRARWTWMLYRLSPTLIARSARKIVRKLRATRRTSQPEGVPEHLKETRR